jgi:hypothetical protein
VAEIGMQLLLIWNGVTKGAEISKVVPQLQHVDYVNLQQRCNMKPEISSLVYLSGQPQLETTKKVVTEEVPAEALQRFKC